jgi:methyl-accepting chemotaxis protein
MTIGKKLWLLAVASAGLLAGVVAFNVANASRLSASLSEVGTVQLPLVRTMTLVDMMHDGIRAAVFRSIISAQVQNSKAVTESSEEYAEFSKSISGYLKEIDSTITGDAKALVSAAAGRVENYVQAGQNLIALSSSGKTGEALKLLPAFQASFDELGTELEKLGELIQSNAQTSVKNNLDDAKKAVQSTIVFGVLGCLFGLVFSWLVNLSLIRTLRNIVNGLGAQTNALDSHTQEVDKSAQGLADSSQEQASAVQETASAIEEINSMVSKTAENSKRLAESSESGLATVQQGQSAVQQMLSEMEAIKAANVSAMKQIQNGNEQIKRIVTVVAQIGEKTKIINEIVFQTKLLSFNASVEAARAGEHGKGFAVVAEEVGNLAKVSGASAKEISDMLEQGIKEVNEIVASNSSIIEKGMKDSGAKIDLGKRAAEQCGGIFLKIVDQVGQVSRLSSEISLAIEEQKSGMKEIGSAIRIFSASADSNSSSARKSVALSSELQESFTSLTSLMNALSTLVTGAATSAQASPLAPSTEEAGQENHSEQDLKLSA